MSGLPRQLIRWERAYTSTLETGVMVLLAILVLVVSAQIYVRTVHNISFSWSDELARLCLAWLTFIGAAVVMQRGAHIRVDIISNLLPPHLRAWLDVVMHLLMLLFLGVIIVAGPRVLSSAHSVEFPALGIPTSFMHAAPWAGALVMVPYLVFRTVERIAAARSAGSV